MRNEKYINNTLIENSKVYNIYNSYSKINNYTNLHFILVKYYINNKVINFYYIF